MPYIARKPFTHNGVKYAPGDTVKGFPEEYHRAEGFVRGGFVVEQAITKRVAEPVMVEVVAPVASAPKRRRVVRDASTEE